MKAEEILNTLTGKNPENENRLNIISSMSYLLMAPDVMRQLSNDEIKLVKEKMMDNIKALK